MIPTMGFSGVAQEMADREWQAIGRGARDNRRAAASF